MQDTQIVDMSRRMDTLDATRIVEALSALAQPTRLDVFRLLVAHAPEGLAAGAVAARLAVPHNTLSTHLAILSRANLIASSRTGRSIVYRARLEGLRAVVVYLLHDCCGGRPDICAPMIADLAPCCAAKEPSHV
jgi:ArsR family transcriptional regulator, arsenate/arsenite/antimonite-responsive transcriptional repressor